MICDINEYWIVTEMYLYDIILELSYHSICKRYNTLNKLYKHVLYYNTIYVFGIFIRDNNISKNIRYL